MHQHGAWSSIIARTRHSVETQSGNVANPALDAIIVHNSIMTSSTDNTDTLHLEVSFDSPTFTHGADKATVEARPTEFKAELRRWYRVLKAANDCKLRELRQDEQKLFGGTTNNNPVRSKVLIRSMGCPKDLSVEEALGGVHDVFYLAHGIAESASKFGKARCLFSYSNHSDNSVEHLWQLRLTVPEQHSDDIKKSLWMLDQFGSIGGRSNNGWGSLSVKLNDASELPKPDSSRLKLKLQDCLKEHWPHAFGQDDKGLMIWRLKNPQNPYKQLVDLRSKLDDEGKKIAPGKRSTTQVHFKVKKSKDAFWAMAYCMPYGCEENSEREVISKWVRVIDGYDQWSRCNPFTEGNLGQS